MTAEAGDGYVLGHTAREYDRLDLQGALYRDVTRRALVSGGVEPGMRVLDLGSGSGDVTLLAAELVGPTGSVVGVEHNPGTVAAATERARARGAENVSFRVGSLDEPQPDGPFHALVGRFILMHQADPAQALRGAVAGIEPGGPVVFIESHMALLEAGVHSQPFSPLYHRVVRWKSQVVRGAGADVEMGLKLRQVFMDAGLAEPTTFLEARVEGGADSLVYRYLAESVKSMLPLAQELGISGFQADDVSGLEDALRQEAVAANGVLVNWPAVAAWSRAPGS